MTRQGETEHGRSYRYLPLSERAAQLGYQTLWVAVFLVFIAKLVLLRIRGAPVTAFELSMIFLAGLLLSPITFTTHLVSLLFVHLTFLSIRVARLSLPGRALAALLLAAMAVTGLSGRDLAGSSAYLAVGGYSVYVWTMLLLFFTAVVLAGREASNPRPAP